MSLNKFSMKGFVIAYMVRYDFVSCAKYIKDHKLQWLLELLLLLSSVVNSTQCNMQCTTKWVITNIAIVTIISFSIISKFHSTFNKICSKIKATQKLRSSWENLNLEFRPNCEGIEGIVGIMSIWSEML